jgi:predicted DNA-binding transcriptional regulator AlpA
MKTPALTINIKGQFTLDRKSLEQFLRSVTPPAPVNPVIQTSSQTGESSFITEMQLLEKLQVSRRTIFSWRMAGKIPTVKIGRRTLYHWPSVEAALLRCQRGGLW